MINIQDNIAEISVGNISIGSAYVGNQLVWQKGEIVYDNDQNAYMVKNYVTAKGYYSFATTPITGKSTDLLELGVTITARTTEGYCWLVGYYSSESNRFGIYIRHSSNRWTFDFWRGGSGSSRKKSSVTPALNRRYDLIVGNTSLTETNTAYAYDKAGNTTIVAEGTAINTTTSSLHYILSENRSGKPNTIANYHYLKIYKQEVSGEPKVLVLDWIPVQSVSDGTWGFYDRITHNFYPSEGTEEFTGG